MGALSDPDGSQPIVAAGRWLEGVLFGSLAVSIAVIAIAWVGFLLLSGRIDIRRGMIVVAGCFILFGAQGVANGLLGLARERESQSLPIAPVTQMVAPAIVQPSPSAVTDPYAGASVPQRP